MYNSDNLEISIRNLKRGLMTGDERVALTAYQSLFDSGQAASPHLLRELKKFVVTTQYRREANNLFAGLLSLHREIDELGSDAFITEAIATKPTDVFAALLNSARRMKSSDYKQARLLGTAIWEHSDIDPRYGASSHICQWLSELPTDDVNGLRRINIVPQRLSDDWAGQYIPALASITIGWVTLVPPEGRLNRLMNHCHRLTLFHEVGHHVHRHWFGQDPQQEAEANAYAAQHVRRTMSPWMRLTLPGLRFLSKRLRLCEPAR